MKSIEVKFKDSKYNYLTNVNGTKDEIINYFVGTFFNLGTVNDNMQQCTSIEFINN